MENTNLAEIIESILFVSGNAIEENDIMEKLNIDKKTLVEAIKKLREKYSGTSGIKLLEFNKKYQLSSNSEYTTEVSLVLNPIRERALTKATLETLSIIAYKQPVTRLDIEEIRGVSSDYAVSVLEQHHLIEVVGRKDAVGKPLLFGTTDEFLKRFNLESINELPDYESLLENINTIHIDKKEDKSLYREYEIPDTEIVPLAVMRKIAKNSVDDGVAPKDEFL